MASWTTLRRQSSNNLESSGANSACKVADPVAADSAVEAADLGAVPEDRVVRSKDASGKRVYNMTMDM